VVWYAISVDTHEKRHAPRPPRGAGAPHSKVWACGERSGIRTALVIWVFVVW
jgi:hypothetical protein